MLPLPEYGTGELELLIYWRWMDLPDELKDDPEYSVDNHREMVVHADGGAKPRHRRLCGWPPTTSAKKNQAGRWAF